MIERFPIGPLTGVDTTTTNTHGLTVGTIGTVGNCWPSITQPFFGYQQPAEPYYDFKVRKVKNGFVVKFKSEEHVFQTAEGLAEFMKASLNG